MAGSALAMARSPAWSGASWASAGCCCAASGPCGQVIRAGASLTGTAGGPLRGPVWEAGVGRAQPHPLQVLRLPLQLQVEDRAVEGGPAGCSGGRGWALLAQTPPGVAPEVRILVRRQAQLRGVAPDTHGCGLRRGRGTRQVGDVRHHLGVRQLGSPDADPDVAGGAAVHQPREHGAELPVPGEGIPDLRGGPAALPWLPETQHLRGVLAGRARDDPGPEVHPPGLAAGAHHQRGHGRGEVSGDLDHRTPDRGLHGRGAGRGCPHERLEVPPRVVIPKGSHVEPTHVGIRQDRRLQDAHDPGGGRHGVQRRRVHVRKLR